MEGKREGKGRGEEGNRMAREVEVREKERESKLGVREGSGE